MFVIAFDLLFGIFYYLSSSLFLSVCACVCVEGFDINVDHQGPRRRLEENHFGSDGGLRFCL